MLIAVDVGNTNVTVGVLKDSLVLRSVKFPTPLLKSRKNSIAALSAKFVDIRAQEKDIEAVYAVSVVPDAKKDLASVFSSFFKKEVVIIGDGVAVPIINRYRIPSQVGQDRLVNAYAGLKMFGPGLIIVDFGTAITFDIVSKRSEYVGGLIVPGLKLMQEALHKKTALLPYVELAKPIEVIGKDTVSSIRAGIVYGTAGMCECLIRRLMEKECRGFKVITTGGDAELIRPYSSYLSKIEESLILKGLGLIFKSQGSTLSMHRA